MQEKVPRNFKISKKYIVLSAIILLFVAFMIAFQFAANLLMPASTQMANSFSTPEFSLYLISLNKSQTANSLSGLIEDYQKIGAGGYVWQIDDCFHVVYGCYEKENDAMLIQKSLKQSQFDSEVIKVDFQGINFNGEYDAQSKKVLSKSLKVFYTTYLDLFDIAASLDTKVYNEISARLAINNCYSSFNAAFADFKTMFENVDAFTPLTNAFESCLKVLESLCSGKLISQSQSYSSLIKYRYTEFISQYYKFLQGI